MPITSPNNEPLKEVRKLAGRKWRDKTRTFVAEGEDLIAAAGAAGWQPELQLCEAGSGLAGEEVAGAPAQAVLPARLGHARARRLRAALGARARRAAVRRAVGRRRPRQRRHGAALRARVRRGQRRARARARPTRTATRRCARRWARSSTCRSCASTNVDELPGAQGRARRPQRPAPLRGARAARGGTLVVGAERDGLPDGVLASCDETVAHPDPVRVAQRGDGGDDRALRSH